MAHTDSNPNRSWALKIGKGGNIYSFVGPYGETVPRQNNAHSPWNDEVWQSRDLEDSTQRVTLHHGQHPASYRLPLLSLNSRCC